MASGSLKRPCYPSRPGDAIPSLPRLTARRPDQASPWPGPQASGSPQLASGLRLTGRHSPCPSCAPPSPPPSVGDGIVGLPHWLTGHWPGPVSVTVAPGMARKRSLSLGPGRLPGPALPDWLAGFSDSGVRLACSPSGGGGRRKRHAPAFGFPDKAATLPVCALWEKAGGRKQLPSRQWLAGWPGGAVA